MSTEIDPNRRGNTLLDPLKEFCGLWKYIGSSTYAPWATNNWEKVADVAIRILLVLSGTLFVATLFSLAPALVGIAINQEELAKKSSQAQSVNDHIEQEAPSQPQQNLEDYIELVTLKGIRFWAVTITKIERQYPPCRPGYFPQPDSDEYAIQETSDLLKESLITACENECAARTTAMSKKSPPKGV